MPDQTDLSPLERRRPVVTVLDTLRVAIDLDSFDAVLFSLESVAADLGYGDVRQLPGAIAWIDSLDNRWMPLRRDADTTTALGRSACSMVRISLPIRPSPPVIRIRSVLSSSLGSFTVTTFVIPPNRLLKPILQ